MAGAMRVGLDGKCLDSPRSGVARYLEGLLSVLGGPSMSDATVKLLRPRRRRRTLPWVLWDLQRATGRGLDVLHCPFYYPPLAPRCPVTVAVHDVLYLQHPEWFHQGRWNRLRWLVPPGARRAAAVVASAEVNAEAIASLCRVPRERIRVIPYGVDRTLFAPPPAGAIDAVRRRHGLDRPYLLVVGPFEPRRGIDLAFAAARALGAEDGTLALVLAGELRAPVAGLDRSPPWVRLLGRITDADLAPLYAGAEAVLAPSRGEGFDLPVLEALACGAVVTASDIAVHREHFASAVELFPSGDWEALAGAIDRVRGDRDLRHALGAAGVELAGRFVWEEVARAHVELWREVVG